MRFRLADLWTMQVLMRMGVVAPEFANAAMLGILASFDAAARLYEKALASAAADVDTAAARLLPLASYLGRSEDAGLALRRAAQKAGGPRFNPPYFPASRARAAAPKK
jgi:hypothetical protein